jgi:hypothetical protein
MIKKLLALLGVGAKTEVKHGDAKKRASTKPKVAPERIGELGEYKINIQLDQLPKECKYVSDSMVRNPKSRTGFSQTDHVVISPYGLFVIETKNYSGVIKGGREDKQWTVSSRFRMYNPLKQNYGHIKALEGVLKSYPGLKYISMISFTMRCRFSIDPELRKIESDELVVYDVELSEFISRKLLRLKAVVGEPTVTAEQIADIHRLIVEANITDPALRQEHVRLQKGNG